MAPTGDGSVPPPPLKGPSCGVLASLSKEVIVVIVKCSSMVGS